MKRAILAPSSSSIERSAQRLTRTSCFLRQIDGPPSSTSSATKSKPSPETASIPRTSMVRRLSAMFDVSASIEEGATPAEGDGTTSTHAVSNVASLAIVQPSLRQNASPVKPAGRVAAAGAIEHSPPYSVSVLRRPHADKTADTVSTQFSGSTVHPARRRSTATAFSTQSQVVIVHPARRDFAPLVSSAHAASVSIVHPAPRIAASALQLSAALPQAPSRASSLAHSPVRASSLTHSSVSGVQPAVCEATAAGGASQLRSSASPVQAAPQAAPRHRPSVLQAATQAHQLSASAVQAKPQPRPRHRHRPSVSTVQAAAQSNQSSGSPVRRGQPLALTTQRPRRVPTATEASSSALDQPAQGETSLHTTHPSPQNASVSVTQPARRPATAGVVSSQHSSVSIVHPTCRPSTATAAPPRSSVVVVHPPSRVSSDESTTQRVPHTTARLSIAERLAEAGLAESLSNSNVPRWKADLLKRQQKDRAASSAVSLEF